MKDILNICLVLITFIGGIFLTRHIEQIENIIIGSVMLIAVRIFVLKDSKYVTASYSLGLIFCLGILVGNFIDFKSII